MAREYFHYFRYTCRGILDYGSSHLFLRTADGAKLFILIDGHGSCLEMPFLQYINTPKDNWIVCIGVPYSTALWQVGDSKEHNGSFNIALIRAKVKILETRDKLGLGELQDTDLIPMIDKNKNAISDCGWNPLNQNILTDRDLRETMTHREKCQEHEMKDDIILP